MGRHHRDTPQATGRLLILLTQRPQLKAKMQAHDLLLYVRPGGEISVLGSLESTHLPQHFQVAVAISALLKGGRVSVVNWLPGVQLNVHADIPLEEVSAWNIHQRWSLLLDQLIEWQDGPSWNAILPLRVGPIEALVIPTDQLSVIGQDWPPEFAIRCRWPGLPDALHA